MDEATLDEIRKNTDFILTESQNLTDFRFGFDERSVRWLAEYIEEAKVNGEISGDTAPYVDVLGSYLGEALCRIYGGVWDEAERGLAVRLPWDDTVYPFQAVERQIRNGVEDSIVWTIELLNRQQAENQPEGSDSLLGRFKKKLFGG